MSGDVQDLDFIETPENVELQRPLAGIGSRFIAGLIDLLLIFLVLLAVSIVMMIVVSSGPFGILRDLQESSGWVIAVWILVTFVIVWGYFAFFELGWNGQTPGKRQQRIRVVKASGAPIAVTDIFIRNLLRIVDFLPAFFGLAGVAMFVTRRCQRLGDIAAGTVVVSEVPFDNAAGKNRSGASEQQWWGGQSQAAEEAREAGLTEEELRLLNSYWSRRHELLPEARERLLPRLLQPIVQRTGETLPDTSFNTLEAYVEKLLGKAEGARSDEPLPEEKLP